jgi:hypothetical protein
MRARARSWIWGIVLLAIGAVVGYAWPQNNVSPSSVNGMVTAVTPNPVASDTTFMFQPKGSKKPEKLVLFPATPWQVTSSAGWTHAGTPTCLVKGDDKITVGLVHVHSVASAPGGLMVTWVECYT